MAVPAPVSIEETDFSTADPELAREFFSEAYGENDLQVKDPLADGGLLRVHRVATDSLSLSDVSVPAELGIWMEGRDDEVLISSVHEGSVRVDRDESVPGSDRNYTAGDIFISNRPGAEWNHETKPVRTTAIGIPEPLLREVSPAGDQPWRALAYEPRPGFAPLWTETTRFLHDILESPIVAEAPLVIGPAARFVAAAASTIFPNTAMTELEANDRRDAHPETLRRAIAFIEANPDQDISAADVAGAAHATTRAVQLAFRRQLDTTPTAYLRQVRLHHAHHHLLAAGPDDGVTVTDVALRWGFATPSRFAEHYRAEYGETPSETLKR